MASLCNSRYTVILLAVLLGGFSLLNRRAYPVHKEGCVVVTGASSGIGKDAALRLDDLGYTVYAGVRKQKDIDALKKERPSLIPIFLDVTDDQQCQDAAKKVADDMKKENGCSAFVGLVNNAGVSHRLPLELEDMKSVKSMYEVNVFGVFRSTWAFLPLIRQSSGRIIGVGSVAALLAHKGSSVYSGTKAALEIMTDVMRLELMPWDVSVSIVEPAYVKTSIASKQIGANAAWRHADKAKLPLYQDWLDTQEAKRATSDRMAATTEVTNDAIVHALTAEYPKTRYVVANVKGIPAWILTRISWLLPDRIKDLAAVKF